MNSRDLSYELIIAVQEYNENDKPTSNQLYSFFPTEIDLPLPVVCHATFELDQSRNHLKKCKVNEFVFKKLALFLTDVAEERAKEYPEGINAGYKTIMPMHNFSSDFKQVGFEDLLYKSARKKKIIPTLSGALRSAISSKVLDIESTDWLPAGSFGEITKCNKEQAKFFIKLGAEPLSNEELKDKLIAHSWKSIDQRVDVICGIIEHKLHPSVHSSLFLVASSNLPIPDDSIVFNSRNETNLPRLPDWQKLWFLNQEMQSKLMARLNTKDVRSLQLVLSSFGVREYSLGTLVSRLIANANSKKKKSEITEQHSIAKELITIVYSLYNAEKNPTSRPLFPANVALELPTQSGNYCKAADLYFGLGYGSSGNILQALYSDTEDEKLIAKPSEFLFCNDVNVLKDFFIWTGVNTWPKAIVQQHMHNTVEGGYLDYVVSNFEFPISFGSDYLFRSKDELPCSTYVTSIETIEDINHILTPEKCHAVAAWLSQDERINQLLSPSKNNQLVTRKSGDRNNRIYSGDIPSYIKWKLESTPWLVDKNLTPIKPKDCIVIDKSTDAIFSRPAKPKKSELTELGITERQLVDGWRKGGVVTNQFELKASDIYDKLLFLPQSDPKGITVKSLYRWFIDIIDSLDKGSTVSQELFFNTGHMWGIKEGKYDYYPISDLRHDDVGNLPRSLIIKLPLVAMSHRVGSAKVEKVFGVKPISLTSLEQKPKDYILDIELDSYFQQVKPYLYAVRVGVAGQQSALNKLKKLKLKICTTLSTEIVYEGNEIDFEIPFWGWIIDEDNNTLYVRSNPSIKTTVQSQLLADSVGSALASIFLLNDGSNFSRLFSCSKLERRELLKSIRGDNDYSEIDEILSSTSSDCAEIDDDDHLFSVVDEIIDPVFDDNEEITADKYNENKPVENDSKKENTLGDNDSRDSEIEVSDSSLKPVRKKSPTKLRVVKRSKKKRNNNVSGYIATDGEFAEKKIVEFEEYSNRFPLRVGQIQGQLGFGCDILSFKSLQLREDFRSGKKRNLALVDRFIEVKGRKNKGAEIELRGNEKDCAAKYDQRYFLYRLSKGEESEYLLSILNNPLSAHEAIEQSIYIDLDRAEDVSFIDIQGGIKE